MTNHVCLRCGDCCRANGLIPPYVDGELGAGGKVWPYIKDMVNNMRRDSVLCYEAQDHACLFLNEDNGCSVHEQAWRPKVCQEFEPGDCPGLRGKEDDA